MSPSWMVKAAHLRVISWRRAAAALGLLMAASYAAGLAQGPSPAPALLGPTDPLYIIFPQPSKVSTLYWNQERVAVPAQMVWRPVCGTAPRSITRAQLSELAVLRMARLDQQNLHEALQNHDGPDQGGIAAVGLKIVFNSDGDAPNSAVSAMNRVADYFRDTFDDSLTIKINVTFDSLDPGVLGATGSYFLSTSWSNARNSLQDDMDPSDTIHDHLPNESRIPVRYIGSFTTITDESRVFWTQANYRAAVGSVSGVVADIVFNINEDWDYNPANGVNGISFEDVLVHEVGHALGFSSGTDFRINDMETLDIFRFQRTDAGHDYNPDSNSDFRRRPRLVSFDDPSDEQICDIITKEHRMSDGDPYQASHFREQGSNIGLMDPALAEGETHYPSFFSSADLRMFDAIGWDR